MTKWISVKDRLPSKTGWYDVITFCKPSYDTPPVEKLERLYFNGNPLGPVIKWSEEGATLDEDQT